jgi:CrcB protein
VGVAVLGALASLARAAVGGAIQAGARTARPVGTLVVNLSGTFAAGVLAGVVLSGDAGVLAGAATLGSYTTFSTWVQDSGRLHEEGDDSGAALNLAVSLLIGVAAVAAGHALGAAF